MRVGAKERLMEYWLFTVPQIEIEIVSVNALLHMVKTYSMHNLHETFYRNQLLSDLHLQSILTISTIPLISELFYHF